MNHRIAIQQQETIGIYKTQMQLCMDFLKLLNAANRSLNLDSKKFFQIVLKLFKQKIYSRLSILKTKRKKMIFFFSKK